MANFRRGSFPQPYGEKKWYDDTNGMPFVQVVDVGNNLKLVNNTKQKISELAQPKSVFVEAGKVVVTLQGSIGRVAITQYPSYVDRTLLIFESYKRPIDEYYFAYVIQQLFEIEKRTAPGGTIKTITKEVLSDFLINIPEFNEQKTLGNFFKQLDDTIALHQRKLVLIKRLKQTYLDALFPQNDGYIPALRFAGFSEPWEQRKVDDLSEETFGGGTPKTGTREYWQGELPWIQSSDLKNEQLNNVKPTKFITDEAIKKSAAKVIPSNSIAIVTRVGVGKLALMPFPYATSQDFFSLSRLKVDPWFAIYRLYKLIQREINNIQGTSIKGMTKADLLDKNVQIPLCSGEQEKIGVIFKQLDNTIVLHQCRLEKLTALKNVLLGRCFSSQIFAEFRKPPDNKVMTCSSNLLLGGFLFWLEKKNQISCFTSILRNGLSYTKWAQVRAVTLNKYNMSLQRVYELAPSLKVGEIDRRKYQQLLNDYAITHEKQTTMDFHHQLKGAILDAVDEGLIDTNPTRKIIIKGKHPKESERNF